MEEPAMPPRPEPKLPPEEEKGLVRKEFALGNAIAWGTWLPACVVIVLGYGTYKAMAFVAHIFH